jgi:hypothetical protein
MRRIALACLAVLASSACSRAAPSATARRVELGLTFTEDEHSKDSHTRVTTCRLVDGVLSRTRTWSGYHPDGPPRPTTERARLDDAELTALIDRIKRAGLERAATSEAGTLGGPGTIVTIDLQVVIDGVDARSRSVLRRAWSDDDKATPALHTALHDLVAELDRLMRRQR